MNELFISQSWVFHQHAVSGGLDAASPLISNTTSLVNKYVTIAAKKQTI